MEDKLIGGKYELKELLGKGAFSRVYLAADKSGRSYACKVSGSSHLLEREAEILRRIHHPLFPGYVDYGQEGMGWLVMEYIQGETLERILRHQGTFSPERAAEIGRSLAEGLMYLHERQEPLLFRDIKPANVMLEPDGKVKLLDFGCACFAGEKSSIAGTPGFGAPEQFVAGSPQGIAVDVYGLGQTLRAMAGNGCGGRLGKVIERCTEKRPEKRLPDMRYAAELLSVCCGKGRFSDIQRAVLQGKILVQKNIWT